MDMENVVSMIGAVIVSLVIGAFIPFECPEMIKVPKEKVSVYKKLFQGKGNTKAVVK